MVDATVNLFVYGTLKNPATFRAVTGLTFEPPVAGYAHAAPPAKPDQPLLLAREAILPDHDLTSPDQLYYYALPGAGRRVHGFLIEGVPAEAIEEIDRYEGESYRRSAVAVMTETGPRDAVAFLGSPARLHRRFGPGYRRALKSELAFRARVDRYFQNKAARAYGDVAAEPAYARAVKELKGATIHDLVNAHFQTAGLSDFFVGQALAGPVRSIEPLRSDDEASLFAESYLALLLRLVLFSQFETRVREQFRYEIDRLRGSDRYYEHTISSLVALRLLTESPQLMAMVVADALADLDYRREDLADYVEWAVIASDHIFQPDAVSQALGWIEAHCAGGVLPLGAELVLSNLPHAALAPSREGQPPFDPAYASFRYFEPFGLDAVCWKLGGHVERRGKAAALVLSLGSVGGDLEHSNPISDDPWVVGQVVAHAVRFFDVAPHALHLSVQVPRPLAPVPGNTLPDSAVRCLLAMAGDVGPDAAGRPVVGRLANGEILSTRPRRELDLLRIAHRRRPGSAEQTEATGVTRLADGEQPVAQYRFARLSADANYEPLILAAKGLQLHYRPGSMLTADQLQADPALAERFDRLADWGRAPTPISDAERAEFLDAVRAGLAAERLGRSPHSPTYLNWALGELEKSITDFNARVQG